MGVGFYIFYLIALIPLLVGGLMLVFGKEVNWIEWVAGSMLGFLIAAIMQFAAIKGQTHDVETWSGQVISVTYHPYWVEEQTYTTTSTDDKGNTTTTTHTIYIPHPEYWSAEDSLGESHEISQPHFIDLKVKLGGTVDKRYAGHGGFFSGDNHLYVTSNTTGWFQPTTATRSWENRIKAAPSTFSFAKVPADIKVFEYPQNRDPFKSDRLLGSAILLDPYLFDCMNSRLGPKTKVNVVLVGFGDKPESMARWQEAAWLRGKKNDLIVCFGGPNSRPTWVKVFGWGSGLAFSTIPTILLEKGVSNDVLPALETEVATHFTRRDWNDFSYITIEVPLWAIWTYALVLMITQTAFWWYANTNQWDKLGDKTWRRWRT